MIIALFMLDVKIDLDKYTFKAVLLIIIESKIISFKKALK